LPCGEVCRGTSIKAVEAERDPPTKVKRVTVDESTTATFRPEIYKNAVALAKRLVDTGTIAQASTSAR
jgi:hypothetical protein